MLKLGRFVLDLHLLIIVVDYFFIAGLCFMLLKVSPLFNPNYYCYGYLKIHLLNLCFKMEFILLS